MAALQIYDRRERALVTAGDALLSAAAALAAPFRRRVRPRNPSRILLFRLERIGDLLMVLPAIADVRAAAPSARIDLVVGSWNAEIARAIPGVDRVLTLDPSWLSRGSGGASLPALLTTARRWRTEQYDVAINFEPDVRSNLIAAMTGARWTAGYWSGGGGAVLDQALEYQPTEHTTDNARRLVAAVFDVPPQTAQPTLDLPESSRREATALIGNSTRPLVAVHVPGGRPVKQWDPDRFLTVARTLVETQGATIVLTGGRGDESLIEYMRAGLPADRVIDAAKASGLLAVGAILEQCDLMITGDTGPMHLAAAVGTPIVAVFGPSDPRRYRPRGPHDRIIRVDLPCAPCNRIRLPPARCTGRTPDCLALVTPDRVLDAALAILDECHERRPNVSS